MKIVDALPKKNSYPLEYHGERIARDSEGNAVLERGRPTTEKVYALGQRDIIRFRFRIDRQPDQWFSEGELVCKYGRKKFKRALRDYMSLDNNEIARIKQMYAEQEQM